MGAVAATHDSVPWGSTIGRQSCGVWFPVPGVPTTASQDLIHHYGFPNEKSPLPSLGPSDREHAWKPNQSWGQFWTRTRSHTWTWTRYQ